MSVEDTTPYGPYGPNSRHSFFRDAIDATLRGDLDAQTRLERYDEETRAANTSTLAGFVTPQYLVDEFAVARGTQRPFADSCTKIDLGDVGLVVNVPRFATTASAGVKTEGAAVVEQDPTSTEVDSGEVVQQIAGQVTITQQALDRVRAGSLTFDQIVYAQLTQSYDQAVENYVLSKVMNDGQAVTPSATTFSFGNFYQDLALAREKLEDLNGNRIPPTHVFTTPDLYSYVTRQLDVNNRPLLIPQFAPGNPLWPDADDQAWQQFTGTILPGNLSWFTDGAIPTQGSNTAVLVSAPANVLIGESAPVFRVVLGPNANQLEVILQFYAYVVCIPRYPGATAYITGPAYSSSLI